MNIVAIETATETVGVAVRTAGGVQAELSLTGRRRHVESLAPAMEHLLHQVGLQPDDLHAVAVDVGPGLFTGLRVGVSAAKGLAQALGLGVVGLSSLDVLIRAGVDLGHRGAILAAVDARRGEVFAVVRHIDDEGREAPDVMAPGLFAPDELVAALRALSGVPVLAIGDGAQRYDKVLGAVPGVSPVMDALSSPPVATLLNLALKQLLEGITPVDARLLVPVYMREADARSNYARIDAVATPARP
ncbi:MAG TPA: tRNA (adenosine(37)-N6)-threonylcarbamoyltransferase complex dimerization subunit type 1 TsaB [Acidimicrobiales bacterium]|nr:tRNA (adenosine(37)-N6)-threonylcarbamoyltransferase complex dimerization subunit type 1 TsaB [Acidimicrobiales bacterium]